MKKYLKRIAAVAGLVFTGCTSYAMPASGNELSVMQLNVWMEAKNVENGFAAVVDEIVRLNPDIVMLCEAHNREDAFYIPALLDSLSLHGREYFANGSTLDVHLVSKFPIVEQDIVWNEHNGVIRTTLDVSGEKVIVYTGHLDYTHYECYLPRGYSGTTWKKIDAPVTDTDSIMAGNDLSHRDEATRAVIADARQHSADLFLFGGDFNEPSHLDWGEDTKNLWDHNGAIVPWSCSSLLYEAGFRDAYRMKYPNPVTHPGFTFPSDNPVKPVNKLTWAPDADERDRIDFIYYIPSEGWSLTEAMLVGPAGSIVRGERVPEQTMDTILTPIGTWPSDHKGVLVKFSY